MALLTAVAGAGMAVGHEVSQRPAAQSASSGLLKQGSRGPAVSQLQEKLGGLAVDGVYGPRTRAAVRRYQKRNGLAVDGIAGPQTLGALGLSAGAREPASQGDGPAQEDTAGKGQDGSAGSGSGDGAGAPASLQRIAQCESGGNPSAVSPDGTYRGKYQFHRDTWRALGGRGDPAQAPEAEQDRRARQLYEQAGTSPWPSCA